LIENDLRLERKNPVKRGAKFGKVRVIGGAVFKFDVESASLLAERKILASVERQSEHLRIIFEYLRGAISLVHVAVDDGDALDVAVVAKPQSGDGNVIEDAETASLAAESVMRASGKIASETTVERILRSAESSADAGERAPYQAFGPWKTNSPDDLRIKGSVEEGSDVSGIMHALDEFAAGEGSGLEIIGSIGSEKIANLAVLGRRELVSRGEPHVVVITVEKAATH